MDKCQPLFHLLRKNAAIEWDEECQKAFDTIKAYLIQPPVLVPPTPDRPLILYLTVRRKSLGCMLGQEDESTHIERVIYYLSKKFTEGESNYPDIEKMCYALVWVMQRLRQYTLYQTIRLLLKADPLNYLLDSSSSMRNIAKWRSEFLIEDDTPIDPDFPDEGILQLDEEEDKPTWKMYFDGAVNSTRSGIGAGLISPDDPLLSGGRKDALAMLASMVSITKENLIEPLEIEITKGPAHYDVIEATNTKPWYEDIKNFLQTSQYPPFADRCDGQTLRRLAVHYFLSGETLYCRSFDATLLRCIDKHEVRRLIEEVHGGSCRPHMNGLMLAKKLMRLGYYWSTMETDCVRHVRHCHRCQVYVDQIKAPPNE
ncbi:hypothetical protein CRG98_001136 [Punica granatum]|uniref:Uncharacterized protein n=1 Tax=Punica granatum TaxID=22663 RepID=A0A2I0LE52_PUNGR|nr:hypothetical protein CRG98_001136 [Punica granatum]